MGNHHASRATRALWLWWRFFESLSKIMFNLLLSMVVENFLRLAMKTVE